MLGPLIYCGVIAILGVGSLKRPAFSLGAILCMFGLEQWGETKISYIASHPSFSNYVSFAIAAFGIALLVYRGRRPRLINGPTHLCVLLLFLFAAASLLWTPIPRIAVEEWRNQIPYVVLTVLIVPLLVQNSHDARDGLMGTLIAGAILVFSLVFFVEWGYRSIVSDVSAAGTIKLPLAIAQMGAYTFILAAIFAPRSALGWLMGGCLMAISIALVLKTGSRGQLIAMLASAAVFAPLARGRRLSHGYQAALFLAFAAVLAVLWLGPGLIDLLSGGDSRFSAGRAIDDYSGRLTMADRLFSSYLQSGPLGLLFGLGTSASFSPQIAGFYTHIVPIEILCELGIVGFMLFLTILVLTLRGVARHLMDVGRGHGHKETARVVAALAALFVCELLLSLKEGSLLRDTNLFLYPILIESVLVRVASVRRTPETGREVVMPQP